MLLLSSVPIETDGDENLIWMAYTTRGKFKCPLLLGFFYFRLPVDLSGLNLKVRAADWVLFCSL